MWEQGLLGNRTSLWRDPQMAYDSGAPEIGFREVGKSGGGAWERGPRVQVFEIAERWRAAGRRFVMDDGAPDEKRTLQGEVCRTARGLESFLEVGGGLPMRQAIAAGYMKPRGYLATKVLLDIYMDPSSRDDLDQLLELFPEATVEFSCFSVDVGVFPNRNVLFWEVRNY